MKYVRTITVWRGCVVAAGASAVLVVAMVSAGVIGCSATSGKGPLLLTTRPAEPESHWVTTSDRWTLHLLRYVPAVPRANAEPVILCHGLSYNNTFWDLEPSVSLAKYLQAEGYDVWSVSLRGCGQSTKPKLAQLRQLFRLNVSALNPSGLANREPVLLGNWSVDDHIRHDVPTTIAYVKQVTGRPQVHWVGHSLGAMVMFGYLQTGEASDVRSFVAMAAPMYMERPLNDVFELLAEHPDIAQISNLAAGTNIRAIFGILAGRYSNTSIDALFMNADNIDPKLERRFHYAVQEDISPGQFGQLLQYLQTGHFRSTDGTIDYTAGIETIATPTFSMSGQLDNMVSPGFALIVHHRLAATDKRIRIYGRINGSAADYGHDDLVIGKTAKADVYPDVARWLAEHPSQRAATQPALLEVLNPLRLLPKRAPGTQPTTQQTTQPVIPTVSSQPTDSVESHAGESSQ